jgi:hypothetical protein
LDAAVPVALQFALEGGKACVPFTPDVARRMVAVVVEFADELDARGDELDRRDGFEAVPPAVGASTEE